MERVRRKQLSDRVRGGGSYFSAPKPNLKFFSSGCHLLDLALGGGWAEGRISNIVGDKSTGKTLLAIEAAANFAMKHPKGIVRYREAEAAFDRDYAGALGMPLDRVDFGSDPIDTVEDLFEDLEYSIGHAKHPELYIVDSLDALSDRGELERDIDKGSYGAEKAKKMSQLFRRLVRSLEQRQITLMVISQIRDKIGITFGRKFSRTGGRALDFYASQVLLLAQLGRLVKTIKRQTRPIGLRIKAKVDKNKISIPYRECEFPLLFGYGIDDANSSRKFLESIKVPVPKVKSVEDLNQYVSQQWYQLEEKFLPKRRKYDGG